VGLLLLAASLLAFLAVDCGSVLDAFADPDAVRRAARRQVAEQNLANYKRLFGHLPEEKWPGWVREEACKAREVRFGVHVRNDNRDRTPPLVRLKAVCGPGDEGEPVITVMTPDEG
jgi:hypothetical protein